MKIEELTEASFHETGLWQIWRVRDGFILLPKDSAVSSAIKLQCAIEKIDWKANAKTGQMQKLAKMCGKEKELQDIPKDFKAMSELADKLLWAMSPCTETYSYEVATQLMSEFNEYGPENWLKKKKE